MRKMQSFTMLTVLVVVLIFSITVFAAESDPFDLSQYEDNLEKVGIPTQSKIKSIKEKAVEAYNNGDNEEAIDLLDKWARSANWMANLVSSGLEPFYSASYDEREEFSYSKINKLSKYESLANKLKQERNEAMVMKAEVLVKIDEKDKAVALYTKTLDLINVNNWDLWIRALNGLYKLIEVDQVSD